MAAVARILTMVLLLAAGTLWLRPRAAATADAGVHFDEVAAQAGCRHVHTQVELSPRFANIMPWLASVGAAVAAADFDGDGRTDYYCTDSGRGQPNALYRNRGDRTFEEVAQHAGVACGNATGACMHAVFGDVDNDGDADLFVSKWAEANQLFLNNGDGTFRDGTATAGVGTWGYSNSATFVDFDRDGWLDLLVTNYFADSLPDPRTGKMARSNLWDPVTTDVMHNTFTHADNGGRTFLFHNTGGGRFEDVAVASGLTFRGWTLAAGAADLDNDRWPDLYLANDFGPDELYFNTGATEWPPRFARVVDTSGHPGIGDDWWKGMNIDFGDVDANGFLDLYVTNIHAKRYKTDEGNMLWMNRAAPGAVHGRGFTNIALAGGASDGGWGWGAKFLDANNDGWLDLFALNGFVSGNRADTYWFELQEMVTQTKNNASDTADWPPMGNRDLSGYEPSRLFVQIPPASAASTAGEAVPQFMELSAAAGITDELNGRGVAVADYDDDGTLDLFVANQGQPSLLYHGRLAEDGSSSHWLGIVLVGRPDAPNPSGPRPLASTANAIGARVELQVGDRTLVREVSGGTGFASQSEFRLHFGLGAGAAPARMVVRWPSGRTQTFEAAALAGCVGGYARLVENGTLEPRAGAADSAPPAAAPAPGAVP